MPQPSIKVRQGPKGELQFEFQLPIQLIKEQGKFVINCPLLQLSTCGSTERSASKNFDELVQIFIEELIDKQTYEKALEELGWIKQKRIRQWKPPTEQIRTIRVPVRREAVLAC